MSYIEKTLQKDEKIIVSARPTWVSYIIPCLFLFAFLSSFLNLGAQQNDAPPMAKVFLFLLTLYLFLRLILREMIVTNKRVIFRSGVLSVRTQELKNKQVESIEIDQSILGRVFDYADVKFCGTGSSKVCFPSICNPYSIKREVEEAT